MLARLLALFARITARWARWRPRRAWSRLAEVSGGLLAAGLAYYVLFSIFPALVLGFTALGLVLGGEPELQADVAEYVNRSLGAELVSVAEGGAGVVALADLTTGTTLSIAGIIGIGVLLFSGLGWLRGLREGLSAVFGHRPQRNPILQLASDLAMLATVGVAVLASVVTSVTISTASGRVLDWLGFARAAGWQWSISLVTAAVILVIDTATLWVLFRKLPGVRLPWRDLWSGALLGAVGLGLLKLFGGLLLARAPGNPFLAAFSVVVGLLLWANIAGRLVLLAAAWAATVAVDRGHLRLTPDPDAEPSADPGSSPGPAPATGG